MSDIAVSLYAATLAIVIGLVSYQKLNAEIVVDNELFKEDSNSSEIAIIENEQCIGLLKAELLPATSNSITINGDLRLALKDKGIIFPVKIIGSLAFNPIRQLHFGEIKATLFDHIIILKLEKPKPISALLTYQSGSTEGLKVEKNWHFTLPGPIMISRNNVGYRVTLESDGNNSTTALSSMLTAALKGAGISLLTDRSTDKTCFDQSNGLDLQMLADKFSKLSNITANFSGS
mgnify:CR=1 FL=1